MIAPSALLKLLLCAGQLKLATVGFSQVGLSEAQAGFFAEHFSVQLAAVDESYVRITTPKDMAALLGIEKQKQLLGCPDDQSSCMAELAGALGADGLVTGQIARVGKSYQLNVKILAADGSRTLYLHSSKLLATEEELLEELNATAVKAVAKLRAELGGPQAPPAAVAATAPSEPVPDVTAGTGRSRNPLKLLPGIVGLAGVAVSGAAFASAADKWGQLADPDRWGDVMGEPAARSLRDDGNQALTLGTVFLSVGIVVLAGTLIWFLLT